MYYYGENSKFKERLLNIVFDVYKKYDDLYDEYEKINDLLFYFFYSFKVWNFLYMFDEKFIVFIFDGNRKFEMEIMFKMRGLLDKMWCLNVLSDNVFLFLLFFFLII